MPLTGVDMTALARVRMAIVTLAAAWAVTTAYFMLFGAPVRLYDAWHAFTSDQYIVERQELIQVMLRAEDRVKEYANRMIEAANKGDIKGAASVGDPAKDPMVREMRKAHVRFEEKWRWLFYEDYAKWSAFVGIVAGIAYWFLRKRERIVTDPLGVR